MSEDTDSDEDANNINMVHRRRWNYETIARIPAMAQAFRAFAHRALCQESVAFLEEVAR